MFYTVVWALGALGLPGTGLDRALEFNHWWELNTSKTRPKVLPCIPRPKTLINKWIKSLSNPYRLVVLIRSNRYRLGAYVFI